MIESNVMGTAEVSLLIQYVNNVGARLLNREAPRFMDIDEKLFFKTACRMLEARSRLEEICLKNIIEKVDGAQYGLDGNTGGDQASGP